MLHRTLCCFMLFFLCCGLMRVAAQQHYKVAGTVTDSLKVGISGANVLLVSGKDSLTTSTDNDGRFIFKKVGAEHFSIQISAIGYRDVSAGYSSPGKERALQLPVLILKTSNQLLKEVVIRAKPKPIRVMKDTLEYNAAAYRVKEGDNVADLLKQLPGLEVDKDYNVKTMGKDMVKLRVNGKDFFTNNVKDFIARLPAGIVSKLQVIDDYGDEANFTGLKVGQPTKMLNIVTKPGMNHASFGSASAAAGTNDMVGGQARFNLWKESKQSSANAQINTLNNGAGTSKTLDAGFVHSDKVGKNTQSSFAYGLNNNSNAFEQEQVAESVSDTSTFINKSKNTGNQGNNTHQLSWNLNHQTKALFLEGSLSANYNAVQQQNSSENQQSGSLRQDLRSGTTAKNTSPNIAANISMSRKLKNVNNSFSSDASFSHNTNNSDQQISTNTLYYDQKSGVLKKDSLLRRTVNSNSNVQGIAFGFRYSKGLKTKDSLSRKSLNFNYSGAANFSENEAYTYVIDSLSPQGRFVDSLSTHFKSRMLNQSVGIHYNFNGSSMHYNIGMNIGPNLLSNRDFRLGETSINTFNYAPSLNFSKTSKSGKTISLQYQGANRNPSLEQLQPIRNTQNLQNIVLGNPDLKPAFSHQLNTGFNYVHSKSGLSLQMGVNLSLTEREIVEHVSLLPDTLNSLKQITRYENVNGNYQTSTDYVLNMPFSNNQYGLSYSGTLGYSRRAIIFNQQKNAGEGMNFSQSLGFSMSRPKFSLNTQLIYSITNSSSMNGLEILSSYQGLGVGQIPAPAFFKTTNFGANVAGNLNLSKLKLEGNVRYNLNKNDSKGNESLRESSELSADLSSRLTVRKSYFIKLIMSKRINYGYSLANTNPFIINTGLEKAFLKKKSLLLSIQGNDLLAQGNNVSRRAIGNTIVDSSNRQQTRFFSLSLVYNLSQFGGADFPVDVD